MKTYSTQYRVEERHIDEGEHASWYAQLGIAIEVHTTFRDELGFSRTFLKEERNLFLLMLDQHGRYSKPFKLGDVINVKMMIWINRPTCFRFQCQFLKGNDLATVLWWEMPIITFNTGKVCLIPNWMKETVGLEKPEDSAFDD